MSSVYSHSTSVSQRQGSLIPIRQKEQGFTGDKKSNLVLMRIIGGMLIFFAVIMSAIGVVYYTQPCCGERWDSSEELFKKQCSSRTVGEKITDTENSASDQKCYTQSMVSLALWIVSGVFVLIGAALLTVSLLWDKKDETELYIDTVRDIGATSRIENKIARAERKEQKKKVAKYEAKLQRKQDLEMSRMESQYNRRNSYPGDFYVQPSATSYGYPMHQHNRMMVNQPMGLHQQNGRPSRIVYSY